MWAKKVNNSLFGFSVLIVISLFSVFKPINTNFKVFMYPYPHSTHTSHFNVILA